MILSTEHLLRISDTCEKFANHVLDIFPEYLTDLRLLAVKIQDIFDASQE